MTHLYIELNTSGIEEVNASIISKLYELASSGDLDNTSDLKGRLHSSTAKEKHVTYLNNNFDDLYISADILYISFDDPDVETYMKRYIGTDDGVCMLDIQTFVVSGTDFGAAYTNTHDGGNRPLFITESERNSIDSFDEISFFNGITTIDGMIFDSSNISSMLLPSSVSILKDWTFSNCANLTSINLDNIQYLYKAAFYNSGLTGIINLSSIKQIGVNGGICFMNCSNITEINCGNSLEQFIGSQNFSNCTNLQTVTGLSNITSIPNSTFENCTSLTSVDIDWTKITSIGLSAFRSSAITGSLTLSSLTTLGSDYGDYGPFRGCTSLTSADLSGSTITQMTGTFYGCTNLTSATIPSTLDKIGNSTFRDTAITSIDLKNVTEISYMAFLNTKLTSIDLSNIVHVTGYNVFRDCTSLTSVTFPSTSFDWFDNYGAGYSNKDGFFRDCTSLTSADLTYAISLCEEMFHGNTALTTVTLSASNITVIPRQFCYHCTSLSSLGEKVKPTRINDRAFDQCSLLNVNTYLDLSEVTYIGHYALNSCIVSGSITLPECTEWGEAPFDKCKDITELHCPKLATINLYTSFSGMRKNNVSVLEVIDLPVFTGTIPNCKDLRTLRTINAPNATGIYSLENCSALTSVVADFAHFTGINAWLFASCTGLNGQTFDFGSSVQSIGSGAFSNCSINLIFRNNSVITNCGYGIVNNYGGTVYVPDNLVNSYKADSNWSSIANLIKGISEIPQS